MEPQSRTPDAPGLKMIKFGKLSRDELRDLIDKSNRANERCAAALFFGLEPDGEKTVAILTREVLQNIFGLRLIMLEANDITSYDESSSDDDQAAKDKPTCSDSSNGQGQTNLKTAH